MKMRRQAVTRISAILAVFLVCTVGLDAQDGNQSTDCQERSPECRDNFAKSTESDAERAVPDIKVMVAGENKDALLIASQVQLVSSVARNAAWGAWAANKTFMKTACLLGFKTVVLSQSPPSIHLGDTYDLNCPEVRSTPANATGIEGEIFLITQGGDLKLARLAKVGLFPNSNDETLKNMPESLMKVTDALSDARSSARRNGSAQQDLVEIECLKGLLQIAGRFKPEAFAGQADETGKFSFSNLQPGTYTIIVFGHGGTNAALWVSNVSVENGKTVSVKMNRPIISCFELGNPISFF